MINFSSFRPVKREEVLHSSVFAQAAAGSRVGTSDTTTFAQRVERDKSRTLVDGYNRANLLQNYQREALPSKSSPTGTPSVATPPPKVDVIRTHQAYNAGRSGSLSVPTRAFREPPARTYNPYA